MTAPQEMAGQSVETLDAVIRAEEAHRAALTRDLLDLAERGQETAEVLSDLRRTEDSLAALREQRAQLEAQGPDQ